MATASDEETVTDIEQVQGVLTEFSRVEAGLAALRAKHANTVYEVTTTAGMDAAKAARAEIREPRFAVEKVRKAAKAPLLAIGRRIDAEAARITDAILAIETPIDDQIKVEEARKVAEREAKRAAEVERLRLEAAAKLKAEEERLAAERAAIAEDRKKAEDAASAERAKLAAERKAIADAKANADREAAEERDRLKAMREAVDRVAAEQAAEAERIAKAASQRFPLVADRAAIEARETQYQAGEAVGIVNGSQDDPIAVWVEIDKAWESLDIQDIDAVELWANWVISEGNKQAEQLKAALAESKWGP